jgi:hypothetical protein
VLYGTATFEPLTDAPWDDRRAREAIREIVDDATGAYRPDRLWPADEWDAWTSPLPLKGLYAGAAGVVWALGALARRGHAEPGIDLAAAAQGVLERWRDEPDLPTGATLPREAAASLLCAETGILAVAWQLAPSDALADDLLVRVRENARNETNELMWGAPGTMLAARAMHGWTGDARWAEAWQESADELLRRRESDGLWTQQLYGSSSRGIGPAHGAVGNVLALLQGGELLPRDRHEAIARESAALLARTAVVEDGLANWPPYGDGVLPGGDGEIRVQWCHGAPGVVTSAHAYLDEELVLAGAELTWRAGAHRPEKGPGICHGTAGNGYALLAVFERTGDERWLERARRFAVHALGQVQEARSGRGHGRYSLWTGDVGVALFAADCLDGRTVFPIVGSWDW